MLPIRTTRLCLRDFVISDFDAVHAYASDADVTRFMFYGPRTEDETRHYLDRVIAAQTVTPRTLWELAMVRESDDRLIGACDLTFDRGGEADLIPLTYSKRQACAARQRSSGTCSRKAGGGRRISTLSRCAVTAEQSARDPI